MSRTIRFAVLAAFALSLAACASQPSQDFTPPTRKLDAKTQLETGRR